MLNDAVHCWSMEKYMKTCPFIQDAWLVHLCCINFQIFIPSYFIVNANYDKDPCMKILFGCLGNDFVNWKVISLKTNHMTFECIGID